MRFYAFSWDSWEFSTDRKFCNIIFILALLQKLFPLFWFKQKSTFFYLFIPAILWVQVFPSDVHWYDIDFIRCKCVERIYHKELNHKYWHTIYSIKKEPKCWYAEVRQFSNACRTCDTLRKWNILKIEMKWTCLKIGSSVHGEFVALVLGSPGVGSSVSYFLQCDFGQMTCSFSDFPFSHL